MKLNSHYLLKLAAFGIFFSGCAPKTADTAANSGAKIRVVAVERVYGDLARQLGGETADVTSILESPSADPHAYEATPRDADAVSRADIVIENGLGYDAFTDKLLAASPRANRTVIAVGPLAGHNMGDNPHVWYEARTLRVFVDAFSAEFARRNPAERSAIERKRDGLRTWIERFAARTDAISRKHAGTQVAITEPVFDYVLHAARLKIATPPSFSHAIEEGNDPAPQDVDTMRTLLAGRNVAAFVYNRQTVEPATTRLLEAAHAAHVTVVPVTETLPANENTQVWIESEVAALERAL